MPEISKISKRTTLTRVQYLTLHMLVAKEDLVYYNKRSHGTSIEGYNLTCEQQNL